MLLELSVLFTSELGGGDILLLADLADLSRAFPFLSTLSRIVVLLGNSLRYPDCPLHHLSFLKPPRALGTQRNHVSTVLHSLFSHYCILIL
jgi:hypothetical protein